MSEENEKPDEDEDEAGTEVVSVEEAAKLRKAADVAHAKAAKADEVARVARQNAAVAEAKAPKVKQATLKECLAIEQKNAMREIKSKQARQRRLDQVEEAIAEQAAKPDAVEIDT